MTSGKLVSVVDDDEEITTLFHLSWYKWNKCTSFYRSNISVRAFSDEPRCPRIGNI
jgi:hypothetical protein